MKIMKVSDRVIHIVARTKIDKGEEILDDYNDCGVPPDFLMEIAKTNSMSLVFKGFNDYV